MLHSIRHGHIWCLYAGWPKIIMCWNPCKIRAKTLPPGSAHHINRMTRLCAWKLVYIYIYVCGSVCQSVLQDDFPCASWDAGSKDQQKVYNDGLSSWCIPAFLSFFLGKLFNSSLDVVEFCRMSFYSCCIFWPQYFGCRVKGLSQTMSFWCKQTTWLSRTHFVGWLENFIKCFWSLLKCHSVRPFIFFPGCVSGLEDTKT